MKLLLKSLRFKVVPSISNCRSCFFSNCRSSFFQKIPAEDKRVPLEELAERMDAPDVAWQELSSETIEKIFEEAKNSHPHSEY
jgi:hypothetical protein